jgi:hypothetical protein
MRETIIEKIWQANGRKRNHGGAVGTSPQVRVVMKIRLRRRHHDALKERPHTPKFIVSVARDHGVGKVRSHK